MIDYHVHTTCSGDAVSSMREMCIRAVESGITEIAFTEHFDNNPADMCYGTFDYPKYHRQIEEVRDEFEDRLTIASGVEFGEPHLHPIPASELARWDLDIVLGAVHWVGDTIVALDAFGSSDMDGLYRRYFEEVLNSVRDADIDVLAHFDLPKRFGVKYAGPFESETWREEIEIILAVMVERGIALEVNTSGLRQPCAESFPALEALKLYRELGGELVTIGSDAHSIRQLGFGLREGMEVIRSAGFDSITLYQDRLPTQYPI